MTSNHFIEEECPKHSDSLNIPDFRDIYHGCMSREVSVKTLKASGENNCYLVRKRINADEDENCIEYILSFLNGDDDYHFKMKKDNKYFIFANRYFPSFKCVISHYMVSNIINDAHLEFGVVNKTITAIRESLRDLPCYLKENVSNERIKELLHKNGAGSYLFRPKTDDNNQFVLMFFDGFKIHKLKLNVQVLEKTTMTGKGSNEPVVVFVLGRNYFESWNEMVENFNINPIVKVDEAHYQDKLVTAVDINAHGSEGDIYRKIKYSNALQPKDIYSVHSEISILEGSKKKWKICTGKVDKEHGQLVIMNNKLNNIIPLIHCNFIPIHFSVHQRHCFLLVHKDPCGNIKIYYVSIVEPMSSTYYSTDMSEEAYAFRPYNLVEYDKEVYHSTESSMDCGSENMFLLRAYDRWVVAVKRHCSNTKDDVANEEIQERHLKLHRYNRRLKLLIGHSGGQEISLVDAENSVSSSLNSSMTSAQSTQTLPPHGQFEIMLGRHLYAVFPRIKDSSPQILLIQDLPSNLNDVSVVFRIKANRRKDYTKELCNYTRAHQELVPRSTSVASQPSQPPVFEPECVPKESVNISLGPTSIQADPPSSCNPITVDCYATIEYREVVILPFKNYKNLSKHIMDNLQSIFSNETFFLSFKNALKMNEYQKLLNCFLYMSIWEKKQVDFLFLFFEVDMSESTPNTYFRNNSSAYRLFTDYVFQFASDWLVYSLVRFFEELYTSTDLLNNTPDPINDELVSSDQLDQTKPQMDEEILLRCLTAALDGINENVKHCPLTLRQLFNVIQNKIERLHPNFNETKLDKSTSDSSSIAAESQGGLRYRLLNNLILLRFFCNVINSRGERQDLFIRKVSDNIRSKRSTNSKWADFPKTFLRQKAVNDFMVKISRLILQTYSTNKSNKDRSESLNSFMEDYREKTIRTLNHELTKSLSSKEKDAMAQQLNMESENVCRSSSLSRQFNEVLEFLTKLKEEPSYFLKSELEGNQSSNRYMRGEAISEDLSHIIEEINSKKSYNNQVLIDRL